MGKITIFLISIYGQEKIYKNIYIYLFIYYIFIGRPVIFFKY